MEGVVETELGTEMFICFWLIYFTSFVVQAVFALNDFHYQYSHSVEEHECHKRILPLISYERATSGCKVCALPLDNSTSPLKYDVFTWRMALRGCWHKQKNSSVFWQWFYVWLLILQVYLWHVNGSKVIHEYSVCYWTYSNSLSANRDGTARLPGTVWSK